MNFQGWLMHRFPYFRWFQLQTLAWVALVLLCGGTRAFAQGGPPMVTDDPGTPGDKHWEINIAALMASTADGTIIQTPYFDINYGWGDHAQLKLETGSVMGSGGDLSPRSKADIMLLGVKYRFVDEEQAGVAISTYPQFQFHYAATADDSPLTDPGSEYFLPIEFSKSFGTWAVNPEIGYRHGTVVPNEIFYGIVLAYEKAKPWELLAEIHVNSTLNGEGSDTLLNAGFRYALDPAANLIAAFGHTVTHVQDGKLEWDGYAGVQLEL